MNTYIKKQFIIGLVWLIIFVVIIGGVYLLINGSSRKHCFDGIKNRNEESIDCGGSCKSCEETNIQKQPEILIIEFIPTIQNYYDLYARIKNPNIVWGIESLSYVFNLYDGNNQLIGYREGKSYVLPQEAKYIIEPRMFLEKSPAKIEFKIKEIIFKKTENFSELELKIKNKNHSIAGGFHKVVGIIENKTSYDLDTIEVAGLLFDDAGKIIAVGKTEMNTVLSRESRGFEIVWPYQISASVSNFDIRVYSNVFSSENFIKTQGEGIKE